MPPEIKNSYKLSESIGCILKRWPELAEEEDNITPVFIFSAGWGSGSTLLQRLVMSSQDILVWGEPLDHAFLIPKLGDFIACIDSEWPPDRFFNTEHRLDKLAGSWIANLTPPMSYLKSSHRSLFTTWLGDSAFERGASRWGIKEVRFTIDHARYLKWLFPKARFLFLYRNLYKSYLSIKNTGWYNSWPKYRMDNPIGFANHWKYLLNGFLQSYQEVDGLLIKYEDLISGKFNIDQIAEHIGVQSIDHGVMEKKIRARGHKQKLSMYEYLVLKNTGGHLLDELGYQKD